MDRVGPRPPTHYRRTGGTLDQKLMKMAVQDQNKLGTWIQTVYTHTHTHMVLLY